MQTIKSSVRSKTGRPDLRLVGASVLAGAGIVCGAIGTATQAHAEAAPYTLVAWQITAGHGHELDAPQPFIAALPGATSLDALDDVLAVQACGQYVQVDLYRSVDEHGRPVSSLWSTGALDPNRDGGFLAYDVLPKPYDTREIPACQTSTPEPSETPSSTPISSPSLTPTAMPTVPAEEPTGTPTQVGPTPSREPSPTVTTPASSVPATGPGETPTPAVSRGGTGTASTTVGTSSTTRPTATELAYTGAPGWYRAGVILGILAIGLGVAAYVTRGIRAAGIRRKGQES